MGIVGTPQVVARWRQGGAAYAREVTPICVAFDPRLARAVAVEMARGKSLDAAIAAARKNTTLLRALRKPQAAARPAETLQTPAAGDEAQYRRRYLLALCRREHGDFAQLDNEQLLDIAALAVKPYASPDEWRDALPGG